MLAWVVVRWVPDKPVALLALGLTPFLVKLMPARLAVDPQQRGESAGLSAR